MSEVLGTEGSGPGTDCFSVSIIVPTLNAASLWPAFHEGLKRQSLRPRQILIIDSGSQDGTPELARKGGYKVVSIPASEFSHGGTRQAAIGLIDPVDIVIYLTQDAILLTDDALGKLIQPFADSQVAATFGRQIALKGSGVLEWHSRNFNYPPKTQWRTLATRDTLGFKAIFFSNSFAAYRTKALQAVGGFSRDVIVSEETLVSARLLLSGWKTVYVAEAKVGHSHHYTYRDQFSRYFDIGVLHAAEPWLLREFGAVTGEGRRFVLSELRHLWPRYFYLLPDWLIRTLIKYVGYKIGRHADKLPRALARKMSSQKQYWKSPSRKRS